MFFFRKYYCPKCRRILKRRQVKRKSKLVGYDAVAVYYMCLECGNDKDVIKLHERVEEIITTYRRGEQNDNM